MTTTARTKCSTGFDFRGMFTEENSTTEPTKVQARERFELLRTAVEDLGQVSAGQVIIH